MKAFLLILSIFFCNIAFTQSNTYELNKKIKISFIKLEIKYGNRYLKEEKRLTNVMFYWINDSITGLMKSYECNKRDVSNKTAQENTLISSSIFDGFVSKLKLLDAERLNYTNENRCGGITYDLEFGDNTYSIHVSTDTPEEEYLKSFLEMYWYKDQ